MTEVQTAYSAEEGKPRPRGREKVNLVALKRKIEIRLERNKHWSIRLTKTRAVVGETYERARRIEALVVYRFGHPVYLSLDRLDEITQDERLLQRDSEYVYTVIKREAERYWKVRPAVRHWTYRDPEEKEADERATRKKA